MQELDALALTFGDATDKMIKGKEKYGADAFLNRDTVQDIKDELLDAVNYLCFLYYKISMMEEALNASSNNPTN